MSNPHTAENTPPPTTPQAGKSPLFRDKAVSSRLYLQVADSLAQLIMTNNLAHGDRLPPERELAQVYEVSRQTIREALIALEVLNVVAIKPGSGVYVQHNSATPPALTLSAPPGYLEIIEGLAHFSGEATFLATQRASNEELLTLHAYVNKIAQLTANEQHGGVPALVQKTHQLIAEASRNTIVASSCQWLWQLHQQATLPNTEHDAEPSTSSIVNVHSEKAFSDPDFCQQFVAFYQEIYALMSRRDAEAARKKMREYLRYLAEYFAVT